MGKKNPNSQCNSKCCLTGKLIHLLICQRVTKNQPSQLVPLGASKIGVISWKSPYRLFICAISFSDEAAETQRD